MFESFLDFFQSFRQVILRFTIGSITEYFSMPINPFVILLKVLQLLFLMLQKRFLKPIGHNIDATRVIIIILFIVTLLVESWRSSLKRVEII